jgi:hypothetical protein
VTTATRSEALPEIPTVPVDLAAAVSGRKIVET